MPRTREGTPREQFEAFCCAQVERIQRNFHRQYGFDYDGHHVHSEGNVAPGNHYYLMPQNDGMTRGRILREAELEIRK